MKTITAGWLKCLLGMVPDDSPVYIVGENNENGIICDVALHTERISLFESFQVRIDYE